MVKNQVMPSDVTNKKLLNAMFEIPREKFVPPETIFYPSFAVFSIYYVINFFKYFKLSNKFIIILILNFIIAIPAIYFIFSKGIYFFTHQGITLDKSTSFNLASKFAIISSILLFFLIRIPAKRKSSPPPECSLDWKATAAASTCTAPRKTPSR